jgi:site-specific recombinase XerD
MNPVALKPYEVTEPMLHTLDWLMTHMDVSAETIGDYTGRLKPFIDYLLANGINEDTFLTYKRKLAADTSIKTSTKNKKLTIARIFLRELHRRGFIPRDITVGIKGFEQSKKHKRSGLDEDDIAHLREWVSLNQYRSPKHLRLTCLLLLLTYHGLRQIEVCRLQYEDIDFVGGRIFIQGKGRDDKEPVHLNPDVADVLRRYCTTYCIASGQVFFSVSNNSSHGKPLSTRGLRATITRLFNRLGIDKNPHGLRHYYVTKLVEEFPGDLFMIMNFTRHRSLDQLQVYNDSVMQAKAYPKHDHVFKKVLV